jgi:hypothetical protein
MDMERAFQSARLIYRTPEETDEDKAFIYEKVILDPVIEAQASVRVAPGKK